MKKQRHRTMFNDQISRQLNKCYGFPENYTGKIDGFEDTIPLACKIFKSDKVKEIK